MRSAGLAIGLFVLAAGSYAQPPGRGPGNWRFVGAEAGRPGPVVRNAPYSADVTTEATQVLADGNHLHQTTTLRVYRDSEGRTRREQSLASLGGLASNVDLPPVVFITDPVAEKNYALSPSDHTATRSGGRGRGWLAQRGPARMGGRSARDQAGTGRHLRGPQGLGNRQNVRTESLGRRTIEGVEADGTRTTLTIPAGQLGNQQALEIVTETWYSPELQIVVLSKRSDPRFGETVTRYTNISRAEPPANLFAVPEDYRITDAGGHGGR